MEFHNRMLPLRLWYLPPCSSTKTMRSHFHYYYFNEWTMLSPQSAVVHSFGGTDLARAGHFHFIRHGPRRNTIVAKWVLTNTGQPRSAAGSMQVKWKTNERHTPYKDTSKHAYQQRGNMLRNTLLDEECIQHILPLSQTFLALVWISKDILGIAFGHI